jgi:hypothetical protein
MQPTDLIIIALLPHPADLERAQAGWYRVPVAAAPAALHEAKAMALYQPRRFGAEGLQVAWWAPIQQIETCLRRDLLPDEPTHPRADEAYLRVNLQPLQPRDPPLRANKARRLLFAPVLWGDFCNATTLDDLFQPTPRPIVDSLMYQLISPQLEGLKGINPPDEASPPRLRDDEAEWLPDW